MPLQNFAGRPTVDRLWRADRSRHQRVGRTSSTECPGNLEYFELVDPDTIRPVDVVNAPVRAALAAWIGKTRLIDNLYCEPRPPSEQKRRSGRFLGCG
jgi:pantothenate synthetase